MRLQGHWSVPHAGGALSTGEVAARIPAGGSGAALYGRGVTTNSGTWQAQGRQEPWFMAMAVTPHRHTVLDDSRRWGIEHLVSDLKSRGFGLLPSPIQKPARLARRMLGMSLALYWAVSCGAFAEHPDVPLSGWGALPPTIFGLGSPPPAALA